MSVARGIGIGAWSAGLVTVCTMAGRSAWTQVDANTGLTHDGMFVVFMVISIAALYGIVSFFAALVVDSMVNG